MKRPTLLDQWNELKAELQRRLEEYASTVFNGPCPEAIYAVMRNGTVETRHVRSVGYYFGPVAHIKGKRPTGGEVEALKAFLDAGLKLEPFGLLLYWTTNRENMTASSATRFTEINDPKRPFEFLDLEKAQTKAVEMLAQRKREEEDLAAGGIRCRYCGQVRKPEDIKYGRVINFHQYRSGYSEERAYCRDKNCAAYDQMASEG